MNDKEIIVELSTGQEIITDVVIGQKGAGVPLGGLTNQVLVKASDKNYDTEWVSPEFVAAVDSVNGQMGDVVLDYADVGAAPTVHTHDDRYYTETEVNGLLTPKMNLDGSNSSVDELRFKTTGQSTDPLLEGQLRWNTLDKTLDIGMDGANIVQQVGMETYYPTCKNDDTVEIQDGELVMFAGAQGNSGVILVKRATTAMPLPALAMGVATEHIAVGAVGRITWFGLVRGIQTNGANYGEVWVDGTVLYNSGTVAGGLSKVKPVAPKSALIVGIVVNANPSNGILFVRPTFFPFLGQLSDVQITNPVTGDILAWNPTLLRWENSNVLSTKVDKVAGKELIASTVLTDLTDGGDTTSHIHDSRYYTETESDTLLGNKVDKETGKSLVSDTLITDLSDGGDTVAHTHKSIVNEVSVDNAKVEALATGVKITTNTNVATDSFTVNKQIGTGNLASFRVGGSEKLSIGIDGNIFGQRFVGKEISNNISSNNALLYMSTTGFVAQRNIADANPALIVNQANASSTGKILDLQFGGVSKGSLSYDGYLSLSNSILLPAGYGVYSANSLHGTYKVGSASAGNIIARNIADANSTLTVNNIHASSTGLITDFQFGGVSKASVDKDGIIATPAIRDVTSVDNAKVEALATGVKITTNVANANTGLILNKQLGTGRILDIQYGGTTKVYVSTSGAILGSGAYFDSVYNPSSTDNSRIDFLSTGSKISRNIADANPALIVNQANASSTGNILDLQFGGSTKARINTTGDAYLTSLNNTITGNNAKLELTTNGSVLSRNVADSNTTFSINQIHASSTGYIQQWLFGGTLKASVNKDGGLTATTVYSDLANDSGSSNARIYMQTNGAKIERNIADGSTALRINQQHASSTGLITDFQFGGVSKASVDRFGVFNGAGIYNSANSYNASFLVDTTGSKISRNIADANPALIVNQANASSTGNIQTWQFGGSEKAYIDKSGLFYTNQLRTVNGMCNPTSQNNSYVNTKTTGTDISRNIADANPALIVNQANASSTGLITDFQFGGVSKASVDKFGTIANAKSAHNPDGGFMIRLTNKTGVASVKGSLVSASSVVDEAFVLQSNEFDTLGIVYETGVADGSECWVVISGVAEVLLKDGTASTRGNWAIAADVDGRADITQPTPTPNNTLNEHTIHFKEIGHCIQSKAAGTNVLAKCVIHFN